MELSYRTAEENTAAHLHDLGFRAGALNIKPEAQKTMKTRHTGLQKNKRKEKLPCITTTES